MGHDKKEMISFYLTTRCNLDCIYCYTNKNSASHTHQTLDIEFAKAGIDDYYKTGFAHHVRFFGAGEPTVEFGLMKRILAYAKKKDVNTTAELQTNGCFHRDITTWIAQNIDIIWISSDGLPEIQNQCRPLAGGGGSSGILEENISYLVQNCRGMTGIRVTITNANVCKQIEIIDYFSKFGIKNFWVDPVFPSIGSEDAYEEIDMKVFTNEFIKAVKYAFRCGITYGSILTCNFNEPGEYACRACLPVPHLTTDGYVSACDMALFGNDANHMNVFIYGKWNKETCKIEYSQEKISYLQSRKLSNMPKCQNCEAGKYCRGYCLGEVMNETKNLFGCKQKICQPTKTILNSLSDEEKEYYYFHP
ncbi:MAG: radical SAM protein [Eubacterium sp.]|nr:radical SAM protein [Eubacterium sp.]